MMVALIRHPGESRDPTVRVTALEVHRAETWIPAFAGMTKLIGLRNVR